MQPEKIGLYEVKSELGRGGMATVYRAYDPRFEREAKIIAQLELTAIVPVYDVVEADGQPFFVMRYMSGGSLSDRMKDGTSFQPLPLDPGFFRNPREAPQPALRPAH